MSGEGKKRVGRKLLIASIGVASVTYGACSTEAPNSDAAVDVARVVDGGASPDGGVDRGIIVGPPPDASQDRQFMGNLA
jgi:hypothetical protein